jgi:hypothetical protein
VRRNNGICFASHLAMLNINAINPVEYFPHSSRMAVRGSNFSKRFAIARADKLIGTTRQYPTWQNILQNDPRKADEVARLILERHAFIAGKTPTDEAGRIQFDRLTERLQSQGIYLYKSHQFNNPIFELDRSTTYPDKPIPITRNRTADPRENVMLRKLRYRFKNRDCLEFLANLLEENGITYYGKKGLANQLIAQARNQGKRLNTYLTGEGLTRELSINPIVLEVKKDDSSSFEDVWKRIRPHIREGSILSFSSQSFGHTGLVDRQDNRWVYLNASGKFGKPETYQIKAEDLKLEIQSWFQRAKRQESFLNITVGAIDANLASHFYKAPLGTERPPGNRIDLLAMHRVDPLDDPTG